MSCARIFSLRLGWWVGIPTFLFLVSGCRCHGTTTSRPDVEDESVATAVTAPKPEPEVHRLAADVRSPTGGIDGPDPVTQLSEPRTLELHSNLASHRLPDHAPTAIAHLPRGFPTNRPARIVLFLHGWRGCVRVLTASGRVPCRDGEKARPGWGLAERHDAVRESSILLAPQLAWMKQDGSPGRFADPGFARHFVEDALKRIGTALDLHSAKFPHESVTVVAHSAGYQTALAIMENGDLDDTLHAIVLMDALYDGAERFADWLATRPNERRLSSIHTGRGEPAKQSRRLASLLRQRLGTERIIVDPREPIATVLQTHSAVIFASPHPHGAIPRRHLSDVLIGLAQDRAHSSD